MLGMLVEGLQRGVNSDESLVPSWLCGHVARLLVDQGVLFLIQWELHARLLEGRWHVCGPVAIEEAGVALFDDWQRPISGISLEQLSLFGVRLAQLA